MRYNTYENDAGVITWRARFTSCERLTMTSHYYVGVTVDAGDNRAFVCVYMTPRPRFVVGSDGVQPSSPVDRAMNGHRLTICRALTVVECVFPLLYFLMVSVVHLGATDAFLSTATVR